MCSMLQVLKTVNILAQIWVGWLSPWHLDEDQPALLFLWAQLPGRGLSREIECGYRLRPLLL